MVNNPTGTTLDVSTRPPPSMTPMRSQVLGPSDGRTRNAYERRYQVRKGLVVIKVRERPLGVIYQWSMQSPVGVLAKDVIHKLLRFVNSRVL